MPVTATAAPRYDLGRAEVRRITAETLAALPATPGRFVAVSVTRGSAAAIC